jgi:hypothetical protein
LAYAYNALEIDGDAWNPEAYGEHPPAQGTMFLNQKMTAFGYQLNWNYSLYPLISPTSDVEHYNILQGKWQNGEPVTYGGTGYNPESTEVTPFAFSGDPVTATGWTEMTPYGPGSEPNEPGDRFAIMTAGPFTLPAGKSLCFDIALPFARDSQGDHISSVTLLKQRALAIQQFYNNQHFANNCANSIGIKEHAVYNDKLLVYPNPTTGELRITSYELQVTSVAIYDIYGRKLLSNHLIASSPNHLINVSHLPAGLYIYRVILQDHSIRTGKIIVQ